MSLVGRYVAGVHRFRKPLAVVWLAVFVASCVLGPRLLSATSQSYGAPSHSPSATANRRLAAAFSVYRETASVAAYVRPVDAAAGDSVLTPAFAGFERAVRAAALSWRPGFVVSFIGYTTALDMGLPLPVAESFVSPGNASAIWSMTIQSEITGKPGEDFSAFLQARIQAVRPPGLAVTLTGVPAIMQPLTRITESELELMDGIVLPIAFLVLALVLRSFRLLVPPLVCIGTSLLGSFTLVYAIAQVTIILSYVPSFMMSVCLALSIDYALFLMSSYRLAIESGLRGKAAVEDMLRVAGHTILVSGSTLTVCFYGLAGFSLDMIRALGLACGSSLVVVMVCNLVITPLALLLFPSFFEACVQPAAWPAWLPCCRWKSTPGGSDDTQALLPAVDAAAALARDDGATSPTSSPPRRGSGGDCEGGAGAASAPASASGVGGAYGALVPLKADTTPHQAQVDNSVAALQRTCWWRMSGWLVRFPFNVMVLVVVVAAVIPLALHCLELSTSDSLFLVMPRHQSSTEALEAMTESFGYGSTVPYYLLIENQRRSVLNQTVFEDIGAMVDRLAAAVPHTAPSDFSGVAYTDGVPDAAFVAACVGDGAAATTDAVGYDPCVLERYLANLTLSDDHTATVLIISPRFDPLDHIGQTWLRRFRDALHTEQLRTGFRLSVSGMAPNSMDGIWVTYDSAPLLCALNAGLLVVFVGLAFRSVLIAARGLALAVLTLAFVYGFFVVTYQDGALNFLHVESLAGGGQSYWIVPIMSFPLVVGISLDYDVLVCISIRRYRAMGFTTTDSIRLGSSATGGVVTAAGLVMAIAFSGLLISREAMMNQLAFLLTMATLFDTLIVRSLCVPAFLSLLGEASWWPGRMAAPHKHLE